jgi:hypothetical protein
MQHPVVHRCANRQCRPLANEPTRSDLHNPRLVCCRAHDGNTLGRWRRVEGHLQTRHHAGSRSWQAIARLQQRLCDRQTLLCFCVAYRVLAVMYGSRSWPYKRASHTVEAIGGVQRIRGLLPRISLPRWWLASPLRRLAEGTPAP